MFDSIKKLKVVEVASVLAGPSVGMFFAELGARVIKIENERVGGDVTRNWKLPEEDPTSPVSAYFASINWGKTHVFADIGSPEGQDLLRKELEDADILIMNFKPGDEKKFGLDSDTLKTKYPQLITGHISGYGINDPRPAFDLALQAETGFMSMNGTRESGPLKLPIAIIDMFAAHQLKQGILAALVERSFTGKGAYIHCSLFDAAVAALSNQASNYLTTGHLPSLAGSLNPNIAPYGETLKCKDGNYIVLAVGSDAQFRHLCDYTGMPELYNDPKFSTNRERVNNRDELGKKFIPFFGSKDAAEISSNLYQLSIPHGIIHNLKQLFDGISHDKYVLTDVISEKTLRRVKTVAFEII